jgi:hypothetical protein
LSRFIPSLTYHIIANVSYDQALGLIAPDDEVASYPVMKLHHIIHTHAYISYISYITCIYFLTYMYTPYHEIRPCDPLLPVMKLHHIIHTYRHILYIVYHIYIYILTYIYTPHHEIRPCDPLLPVTRSRCSTEASLIFRGPSARHCSRRISILTASVRRVLLGDKSHFFGFARVWQVLHTR